jgi:vancomycin resistance protein YoaR
MAKRKLDAIKIPSPQPEPAKEVLELEDFQEAETPNPGTSAWQRAPWWLRVLGSLVVLLILLIGSFELVYAGKVYPGVSADGVYLGGLSKTAATARLAGKTSTFAGEVVTITSGDTNLRIPVASLAPKYDTTRVIDLAYSFGRQGNTWNRLHQQARALLGRASNFSVYTYDDAHLVPYLTQLYDDLITPVQDASLSFDNNHAQVTPATPGARLDLGRITQLVADRLSQTSTDAIAAPVYQIAPQLDTGPLAAAIGQLNNYLSGPITLSYSGVDRLIDQKTLISWIQVGTKPAQPFLQTLKLDDLYPPAPTANLSLNHAAITAYVAGLAGGIDQTAQNAGLAMQNGQLTIVSPSKNGVKLDQADAVAAITASLTKTATDRHINLKLASTPADVNETNLDSLGIKEQISEGETYFPGSPSTRLINVRAGAKRFNGVLLKPGETFSFGKLLGDVGPETGYVPELVILGDHEEKQYGGGLCQVSSTAFRAALAAGLPITERVNHAFAISYYTWPYSVPGLDATIYYPQVDFKFLNDTGHYILIQTVMNGVDLKFDFFGTKTKTGVIRGPNFVTGSGDATQPSHTVFYRDVLDLAGNVVKTDTFNTYYKSSKDFPITKQFN